MNIRGDYPENPGIAVSDGCYNLGDDSAKCGGAPMDLSLVLACYNEEPWLANSVGEIVKVLNSMGVKYEIILVDDASRDRTREVIRETVKSHPGVPMKALFHEKNTGWGGTVADGIREASGEIVGFIDVDLEIPPRYIPDCCLAISRGAQVAVGARAYKFVFRGLWRRFLSATYAALVRLLLPVNGRGNLASGCKFFRRKDILPVMATVADPGWFWDLEMIVRCRLAGLSIVPVPCLYIRNPAKPSSVRVFRDGYENLVKLIAFRNALRRSGLLHGGGVASPQ